MCEGFDKAFGRWFEGVDSMRKRYMRYRFPNIAECYSLSYVVGGRYIKVIENTTQNSRVSQSVFAFVDTANGDVLKPAIWRAPAKYARGNIFDEHGGLRWVGPYGPAYLKGRGPEMQEPLGLADVPPA
jgi:hypothetical protein